MGEKREKESSFGTRRNYFIAKKNSTLDKLIDEMEKCLEISRETIKYFGKGKILGLPSNQIGSGHLAIKLFPYQAEALKKIGLKVEEE